MLFLPPSPRTNLATLVAAKFKEANCNTCYGNKPQSDYPLNLWLPQPPLKMAVMMKWLSFITFFSLNPPQFIRGGVPWHNNAKTHFHGSPHCRMSTKGETTDFLCKGAFWKGEERRQLILLLQMTSVFCLGGGGGAEGSGASMTSAHTL